MKKINLNDIVVDNNQNIKDIIREYEQLKISIKDSNKKINELNNLVSKDLFDKYNELKRNNSNLLSEFLLNNPLLSEFIDEHNYNILLNDKLENIFRTKVDLSKLSNGIKCNHEFIKLNNKLLCIKCFLKEDELNYNDNISDFLKDALDYQKMYIDEIDEGELSTLENIEMNYKNLIQDLKLKRENLPRNEKELIDETINKLIDNKLIEYRKELKKYRNNNTVRKF